MIIKKDVKCKECGHYMHIYIREGQSPQTVTIKCKCGDIIKPTFRNPLNPWMHK